MEQVVRNHVTGTKAGEELRGRIFDIRKYSIHDGPGIRTTVFLKGCPLRCQWCHNPEGISPRTHLTYHPDRCIGCRECEKACPNGVRHLESVSGDNPQCVLCGECILACPTNALEMIGRDMTVSEVVEEVLKDEVFYDQSGGGVTFSGGEPLLQGEFLVRCLKACGARGLHRAVDTTGYADTATLEMVSRHTDVFLYDIKHMNPLTHTRLTGVSNERILQNIRFLAERKARVIVRIPVIPGINDDDENMGLTGAFISTLPGVDTVHLLPYHGAAESKYSRLGLPYSLSSLQPPTKETIDRCAQLIKRWGLFVVCGGLKHE